MDQRLAISRLKGGRRRLRSGTAATEFVLILPPLLLLGFGCVDVGRAVEHYIVVSNAANVGAHYAATHRFTTYTRDFWETRVRAAVREELASLIRPGVAAGEFHITIETEEPPTGSDLPKITVAVTHDFQTTFRWPGFPQTIHLHGQSCLRQYQ